MRRPLCRARERSRRSRSRVPRASIVRRHAARRCRPGRGLDRKSTRLNSSHRCISYAVFCLKKKKEIEGDAKSLIGGANLQRTHHEADPNETLTKLPGVLEHIDSLLGRTNGCLTSHERNLTA